MGYSMSNFSLQPPKGWELDAACQNRPLEWFALPDNINDVGVDIVEENIDKGLMVCVGCPVRMECNESAFPEDFSWTIRGGKHPTGLSPVRAGRPATAPRDGTGMGYCTRGHDKGVVGLNPDGRCWACRVINKDRTTERNELRSKGLPSTLAPLMRPVWEYADRCPDGHLLGPVEARQGPYCMKCPASEAAIRKRRWAWRKAMQVAGGGTLVHDPNALELLDA
jgi:hypothetical protein